MKELEPKSSDCVLYARKSTEEDDRQVMSIEAQLFELREYAQRERIEIVREYTEAKSAKKPGRGEFGAMLDYVENNPSVGILAWHPDRLARNSVDGGRVIYLVDTGAIASLRFPQFWFEPTPQGKFMLQVAFGQSKYFSDNLVENVKRGIRQKLRKGEWLNHAPRGYVNNLKTRTIEPDPVMSRVVKLAFEEYAKGTYTFKSLAEFLAEHGMTGVRGTPLAKASVEHLLTNRAYLGLTRHKDEWHDGSFEPILSATQFEAVQKVLKSKQRPRKSKVLHPFPFTQFARCGECAGMITAQYAKGHGGIYVYYRCSKKLGRCGQSYVQAPALAGQIRALLQSVSLPPEAIEKMETQIQEWEQTSIASGEVAVQNLKTKVRENKEKTEKLISLYLDGDIEREAYLTRKDLLLREKARLLEQQGDFGQQGKNRLEPVRRFVLSLKKATDLAETENHFAWRDYFREIGSNPEIKNKTISPYWG